MTRDLWIKFHLKLRLKFKMFLINPVLLITHPANFSLFKIPKSATLLLCFVYFGNFTGK